MNILIHISFIKSLNKIPYRKLSRNCKQYSKMRKEHVLIKSLFNKIPPYLLYYKLQGYGKTLFHQRCSESQKNKKQKKTTSVCRYFTK